MKHETQKIPILHSALAVAFALTLSIPVNSRSGEAADEEMMARCQDMMVQKQKIWTDIKAQDYDLTTEVDKMNRAAEKDTLEMLAAVVTRMVEQQTAMNARKEKLDGMMMKHMMQHMEMGKASMSQCPMMNRMKGMDDKSEDSHKRHHVDNK